MSEELEKTIDLKANLCEPAISAPRLAHLLNDILHSLPEDPFLVVANEFKPLIAIYSVTLSEEQLQVTFSVRGKLVQALPINCRG